MSRLNDDAAKHLRLHAKALRATADGARAAIAQAESGSRQGVRSTRRAMSDQLSTLFMMSAAVVEAFLEVRAISAHDAERWLKQFKAAADQDGLISRRIAADDRALKRLSARVS